LLHAVIGVVLLVLGAFGLTMWWQDFGLVLRGLIPFLLVIGGLVAIGAGLTGGKMVGSSNDSQDKE
jgi:hypothetical protein